MNREEMLNFLKNEARGISVMFGPNCETIVHDMTRPGHPILAIFNGTVTGREVGSTADIFGDIGDYDESIYQNKDYINQLVLSRDGARLKARPSILSARTIISRWASIWISPTWCAPVRCSAS